MEMFFRLANDKYIRTGICKQYCEAVMRFFKKDILPKFIYFDRVKLKKHHFLDLIMEGEKILDKGK